MRYRIVAQRTERCVYEIEADDEDDALDRYATDGTEIDCHTTEDRDPIVRLLRDAESQR